MTIDLKGFLLFLILASIFVGLMAFSGCAFQQKQVKVIKSDTELRVLRLTIDDGDVITCDNVTCKVVPK